jgi:hypothetical protein
MQIQGLISRQNLPMKTIHLAEVLNHLPFGNPAHA